MHIFLFTYNVQTLQFALLERVKSLQFINTYSFLHKVHIQAYTYAFTVKKGIVTVAQRCVSIGTIANLLSSIVTILLTCPNIGTLLCYSNDPFVTVFHNDIIPFNPLPTTDAYMCYAHKNLYGGFNTRR